MNPIPPLDYATPPPPPRKRIDWDFWFILSIPVVLLTVLGLAYIFIWGKV